MRPAFRYIGPAQVEIGGVPAAGMTICAATGSALGRLHGFIVDTAEQHIRYVVVQGFGLFAKARLLPFAMPRVDFDRRLIQLDVSDQQLRQLRDFSPDTLLA